MGPGAMESLKFVHKWALELWNHLKFAYKWAVELWNHLNLLINGPWSY